MPRIYMAIAQEDRFPIADILRQTPEIPANCQWALFLRNHDELTLEMVTDVERDYLWSTYANDPRARINLGIRRRLASLMDNDRRKIELMNSLLFSFPGTPIIYYGDEIGMGDNIYLGDRNGVRTPMQWTSDRNGGFSRCDPARLFLPVIMDPVYGHQSVNVEAQQRSPSSFLSWMKRLIGVRRSNNAFSRGTLELHPPGEPHRAGLRPAIRERHHRVCRQPVAVGAGRPNRSQPLEGPRAAGDAGADGVSPHRRRALPRHARALRLLLVSALRSAEPKVDPHAVPREFTTLVWTDGSNSLIRNRERHALEHDVLPHFLLERRWFAEKARGLPTPKLQSIIPLERDGSPAFVIIAVPGGRQDGVALSASLDRQMDPPRSGRGPIGERRRRDPPRRARRHPDRCRRRSGFHRDPAAGHACRRLDCSGGLAAGVLCRPLPSGRCRSRKWKRSRAEPRAVQHHRDRGCELRREDLPQAQRRHSPRDRDRALPDRAYRLPERP